MKSEPNEAGLSLQAAAEWVVLNTKKNPLKKASGEAEASPMLMHGPYEREELLRLISFGKISYDDHVWREGFSSWVRIGDCDELDRRKKNSTQIIPDRAEVFAKIAEASQSRATTVVAIPTKSSFVKPSVDTEIPQEAKGDDLVGPLPWMRNIVKSLGVVAGALLISKSAFAISVLKVLPSLEAPETASIAFQTDAQAGEKIEVEIRGEAGKILRLASYRKTFSVEPKAKQPVKLDLSNEQLPEGSYTVVAQSGAVRETTSVFVGKKNASFEERLSEHFKSLSAARQNERMHLFYSARALQAILGDIKNASKGDLANKKSNLLTRFQAAMNPLTQIQTERGNQGLAYPEEIATLFKNADAVKFEIERATASTAQRGIASEGTDRVGQLSNSLEQMKTDIVQLVSEDDLLVDK